MRIIDGCPHWLASQIQRMLGEKLMQSFHSNQTDEMRRVAEALEWLATNVELKERPKLVPEEWRKAASS